MDNHFVFLINRFWAFVELESVKLELPNEIHWTWSRFMYDFNSFCETFSRDSMDIVKDEKTAFEWDMNTLVILEIRCSIKIETIFFLKKDGGCAIAHKFPVHRE
ncbi:hypothetical protein F8M41_025803 [Gigaspora margarita]|uniref:Uncharacterized protein n=1 Tax=Gigaspora margarita TaxID=4874 RepID=A0A8H4AZZ7_GIGMA|nr:hypothetical protein F8M41_025803 [Gigaspora margarita]